MGIIISQGGKNAQKVNRTSFGLEDRLQQFIQDNPASIPIDEIKAGLRLLILAREFPTNSGPIDALGIDQEGSVYVIETKLYKNADKRRVLAQAFDMALLFGPIIVTVLNSSMNYRVSWNQKTEIYNL